MTPEITRISEIEREGRYLDAYQEWYRKAIEELLDSKLRPWKGGGSIHGSLVYATSCAVRGKLPAKAQFSAETADLLTEHVKGNPPSNEAEAFTSSCIEWSGDAYLLFAPEQAIMRYEQAEDRFEGVPEREAVNWGMEAGYEHSGEAILRYFNTVDYGPSDMVELASCEYKERLDAKLKLATEMLSEKYN